MTNILKAHIEASKAAAIKELLAQANALDDDELVHDMIEGETSYFELLESLLGDLSDCESMSAAIKLRNDDLATRRKRYDTRAEKLREVIQGVMQTAGERKAELPEATLSIGQKPQKVMITDEQLLSDDVVKIERKPDLRAIGDKLKAGEHVDGAELSNGGENLIIRRK